MEGGAEKKEKEKDICKYILNKTWKQSKQEIEKTVFKGSMAHLQNILGGGGGESGKEIRSL